MVKSTLVSPRKLKGFQDKHPQTMAMKEHIMQVIRQTSVLAGFKMVETPTLEYSEVLLGVGAETDKQVYRFLDNGKRDVALRYDLTVPFARYVAENHGKLSFPFKRLQMGQVFRAEKPQKGRFREFAQCDLDIIGVVSPESDLEILSTLSLVVEQVLPCEFTTVINNRVLLTALVDLHLQEKASQKIDPILIAIDKLAKLGVEKVAELICDETSCSLEQVKAFLSVLSWDLEDDAKVKKLQELLVDNSEALKSLSELLQLRQTMNEMVLTDGAKGKVKIDLSIARGLGYYTGVVFETVIDDHPSFGSICSGGRYDQLTHRFLNKDFPGVGGSIGLDRLVSFLETLDEGSSSSSPKVFVAVADPKAMTYAYQVVTNLRKNQIAAEMSLKTQKLSAQFRHASRTQYPFVITVGHQEMDDLTFNIKNMTTSDEIQGIEIKDLVSVVSGHLKTL